GRVKREDGEVCGICSKNIAHGRDFVHPRHEDQHITWAFFSMDMNGPPGARDDAIWLLIPRLKMEELDVVASTRDVKQRAVVKIPLEIVCVECGGHNNDLLQ